jgi:hypothetical protein
MAVEHDGLASLDERINWKGHIERILQERDKTDAEREKRMDERFEQRDKALEAAFQAAKEANTKAELAQTLATTSVRDETQIWQKEHNNLLREMVTQKESFSTKAELIKVRDDFRDQIESVEKRLSTKTDEQDTRLDLIRGRGFGLGQAWNVLIVVGGIVLTIVLYYLAHH